MGAPFEVLIIPDIHEQSVTPKRQYIPDIILLQGQLCRSMGIDQVRHQLYATALPI